MLYLAIPAHNEAATIGVLLWRLRTVLAEFPREYEAVVYDDASSDSTSEILESYARVMPLTVLRGERQVGYAGAVDALVRHVARDTRYPRRDAMLLLQGDFTDSPALVPEFVKRFEGGTDVVVGERGSAVRRKAPTPVKRLLKAEPWLLRFLVRAEGIRDLTGSYRLIRISVLRDLLRVVGDAPVCAGDSRTANADFLMRIVPLARRVETLPVEPTWDVRLRETRVVAVADGMNLLRWAWRSRGQRAVPSTAPEPAPESPRHGRSGRTERGDREGRPELRLEGRPDRHTDSLPAATEIGRLAHRDSTRGANRNNRSARSEESGENRSSRPARSEERGENPRATRDRGEPRVKPLEREALPNREIGADTEGGAKPARRKRSRKSGRERALGRSGLAGDASVAPTDVSNGAPALEREIPLSVNAPDGDHEISESAEAARELSPALYDAVDDAEAALDGGARLRPARKKRRRRGSRGGGLNGDAGDDQASGHDQTSGAESSESSSDGNRDLVDSGRSPEDDADSAGGEGDAEQSNDAGARVRRRGRRGRRGGTRRSRSQQGEAPSEGGVNVEGGAPSASPAPE